MSSLPVLQAENLSFRYPNERKAVFRSLNLSVETGESVAVLGANGTGKTTLLKCLLGFIKPESGTCSVCGKNLSDYRIKDLFRIISYVPQIKSINYSYTVLEAVLMGCSSRVELFGKPSEEDEQYALSIIEELGIKHLKDKSCSNLSGGEFQLVLIGRALCSKPKMIILDEPESNLDIYNRLVVMETISALKKNGVACLFNTHSPSQAIGYADKTLILFPDGSSLFGDVSDIITEESLKNAFNVNVLIHEITTDDGELLKAVIPVSFGHSLKGKR